MASLPGIAQSGAFGAEPAGGPATRAAAAATVPPSDARLPERRVGAPAPDRPARAGTGIARQRTGTAELSDTLGAALIRLRSALGPLFGAGAAPALEGAATAQAAETYPARVDGRVENALRAYRRAGHGPDSAPPIRRFSA